MTTIAALLARLWRRATITTKATPEPCPWRTHLECVQARAQDVDGVSGPIPTCPRHGEAERPCPECGEIQETVTWGINHCALHAFAPEMVALIQALCVGRNDDYLPDGLVGRARDLLGRLDEKADHWLIDDEDEDEEAARLEAELEAQREIRDRVRKKGGDTP